MIKKMDIVTSDYLKKLYVPPPESHKGQNGRLLIIGGSHLFHAASLWALEVASRIVDLVHYSSVPENNEMVRSIKEDFRNGIVVERKDLESYIAEDDVILIGPGMVRSFASQVKSEKLKVKSLEDINEIEDEGLQTQVLTNYLFQKYPHKQWVIDAGALQMMDVSLMPKNAILTPHHGEFERLKSKIKDQKSKIQIKSQKLEEQVEIFANKYKCVVLLKGVKDIASNGKNIRTIEGGNAGMTKGGTGDVLAGLIAALACKNDPFLATIAGSFINKKAGDELYARVGPYFNATDLANQIPETMKQLIIR